MTDTPQASAGNVVLSGYISVPANRVEAIAAALVEHIDLTRAEEGCVYFDVTPDPQEAGRFNVYEIFKNRDAFDYHQSRAQSSSWAEISAGIERNYRVSDIQG